MKLWMMTISTNSLHQKEKNSKVWKVYAQIWPSKRFSFLPTAEHLTMGREKGNKQVSCSWYGRIRRIICNTCLLTSSWFLLKVICNIFLFEEVRAALVKLMNINSNNTTTNSCASTSNSLIENISVLVWSYAFSIHVDNILIFFQGLFRIGYWAIRQVSKQWFCWLWVASGPGLCSSRFVIFAMIISCSTVVP